MIHRLASSLGRAAPDLQVVLYVLLPYVFVKLTGPEGANKLLFVIGSLNGHNSMLGLLTERAPDLNVVPHLVSLRILVVCGAHRLSLQSR